MNCNKCNKRLKKIYYEYFNFISGEKYINLDSIYYCQYCDKLYKHKPEFKEIK